MSRSGYTDDTDDQWLQIRWRGAVASAIRGKRGQAFLRELRDALDAMPEKRLIAGDLVNDEGECCALGCVGRARQLEMAGIDPEEYEVVSKAFALPEALVRELEYENDDAPVETPESRWRWVRKWVDGHLKDVPQVA